MKRPRWLNADTIAWASLFVIVALIFAFTFGCKSATCVPQVIYKDVLVPSPCVVQIGVLEPPSLPPYPPFDPTNVKEWALQVEQIVKQREAILKDYSDRLNEQISGHNRLEPKCEP